MANEVLNIRKTFYETSLDYTLKLNDMNGLKRQDLLDTLLSIYFAYYEHFREAWNHMRSVQPIMTDLKSK
jgi:hypothetical protein